MSEKRKIKRALISVYDKTGLVEFARALVEEFGIELISTGGTAKHLKEAGLPVTLVEEITGFPEMLDGRVKTLHPKIHAGILADRDNPEHMRQLEKQEIKPIDMVVVNLYPFEKTVADPNCTFEQAIEMIDIGGPCMLRAAAKNHKHVLPIVSHQGYQDVLNFLRAGQAHGFSPVSYARGVFSSTCQYDGAIAHWFRNGPCGNSSPYFYHFPAYNCGDLRYGENPHQNAILLQAADAYVRPGPCESDVFLSDPDIQDSAQTRRMSFNNYVDANAALELAKDLSRAFPKHPGAQLEFERVVERVNSARSSEIVKQFAELAKLTNGYGFTPLPACIIVKHSNPCGAGIAHNPELAYKAAYLADPNAAMGGILACNFAIEKGFAETVMDSFSRWGRESGAGGFFVEVWIAPGYAPEAITLIRNAKAWGERVRLVQTGPFSIAPYEKELELRSVTRGMLAQTRDLVGLNEDQWKVATKRKPSESEMSDMRLAWLVAKHTKSNAISICKDGMLIGNGAGQMSRVMSCRIATWLAKENRHEDKLKGSVAASDAFFPFPDGPTILMDAGVTAIIQPGGSKNDDKTIAACDERNVAMIFTGTRHFKH